MVKFLLQKLGSTDRLSHCYSCQVVNIKVFNPSDQLHLLSLQLDVHLVGQNILHLHLCLPQISLVKAGHLCIDRFAFKFFLNKLCSCQWLLSLRGPEFSFVKGFYIPDHHLLHKKSSTTGRFCKFSRSKNGVLREGLDLGHQMGVGGGLVASLTLAAAVQTSLCDCAAASNFLLPCWLHWVYVSHNAFAHLPQLLGLLVIQCKGCRSNPVTVSIVFASLVLKGLLHCTIDGGLGTML